MIGNRGAVAVAAVVAIVVVALAVAVLPSTGSSHSTPSATAARLPPAASPEAPAGLLMTGNSMPDPYVLVDGSHDYLYTGGYNTTATPHVPVRPFTTLSHLPVPTDAMPTVPPGTWGWIWTVDVVKAESRYVMWLTTQYPARLNPAGVPDQCVTNATSSSPLGPFVPYGGPVICQQWGSIDPSVVTAPNGQMYLLWKSDLNADHGAGIPTTIWEEALAPNGISLVGSPHQIAIATKPWEGALIESPDMVDLGGNYYLFFSGNASLSPANGVGMMPCASIQGPCYDTRPNPLISSNIQGAGPGEESLFQQGGNTWLLYSPNAIFGHYLYRPLAVARIAVGPHGPYVARFDGAKPGR